MILTTKFDENDIIECLDLLADNERRLKILAIMGWGPFNGFQYRCLEVDKDGNSIFTPEVYDDGDFDRQFEIYKVIQAEKPKPTKAQQEIDKALDGLDKLMQKLADVVLDDPDNKSKGGKRK